MKNLQRTLMLGDHYNKIAKQKIHVPQEEKKILRDYYLRDQLLKRAVSSKAFDDSAPKCKR